MTRLRLVAGLVLSIGLAHVADAQLPQAKLYSVFPPGAQAGTTVELRITGGEDLDEVDSLYFTHPGITAEQKAADPAAQPAPPMDGERRRGRRGRRGGDGAQSADQSFVVTIAADVPPGVYEVAAMGRFGGTNMRSFIVGARPEINETEGNNEAGAPSPLEFSKVVNGRMDGGTDVDWFKFTGTTAQRIVFNIAAASVDSRIDPVLEVYDATARRRLRTARSVRDADTYLVFDVPADGEYLLRLFDRQFRNGNDYVYRLVAHTGPQIAFVLPPAGLPGSSDKYALFGFNLPGGQLTDTLLGGAKLERLETTITLPVEPDALDVDGFVSSVSAATDAVSYQLDSPQGPSNKIPIFLAQAPVTLEQEPNNEPAQSQVVAVPAEVAGQFAARGDVDYVAFQAKAGEVIFIEAFAERLGSTADPYLTVDQVTVDPEGKETVKRLAAQDDVGTSLYQNVFDTQTDDAVYRLQVPADGLYRVSVRDRAWETRGDPSLVYRLAIRPERPDFRLVAVPMSPTPGQTSPVGLRQGDNFPVNVLAFRTDGFNSAIDVAAEELPPGVTCQGTTIGPNQNTAPLVFTAAADAVPDWYAVRLVGKSRVEDPSAARAVDAAKGTVTNAEKPLADLRKALAAEDEKVQKATAARDEAKTASDAQPDDADLKQKLEAAQKALDAAQAARQPAADKLAAGDKAVTDAKAALAAAEQDSAARARDVTHRVRAGEVVWGGQNNGPATSRVAETLALSVMPEPAPFQVSTDVFRVDASQSRLVLVPVKLEKRSGFDEKVALNFTGLPNNSNIEVKNDAIDKGQAEKLLRIFVKDNAPPGVYTIWLSTQGQVSYARNPEKADRLKQAFDAVAAEAKTAQEGAQAATQVKTDATQKATQAAEGLKKAQDDKAAAEKNLQTAAATVATAKQAKDAADKKVTETADSQKKAEEAVAAAQKTLSDAEKAVTDAEAAAKAAAEALDKDTGNEDLKKQKADADAALTAAQQTRDNAKTALATMEEALAKSKQAAEQATKEQTDAVKALTDADTAARLADEAVKKAVESLTAADAANKAAEEAKAAAEKAETEALAKAKDQETKRQAAEKASIDAANAAKPQNKNFTPTSTPIVIAVKPAPVKLAANVPNSGNLKKGESLEVKVTVTRQNGFAGPVQLTLPLPPGVAGLTADNPTIAADQSEGTLKITAAADATEGQIENLVIRGTMEFAGEAAVDIPVSIKVNN
jgi:hypothetical protein